MFFPHIYTGRITILWGSDPDPKVLLKDSFFQEKQKLHQQQQVQSSEAKRVLAEGNIDEFAAKATSEASFIVLLKTNGKFLDVLLTFYP